MVNLSPAQEAAQSGLLGNSNITLYVPYSAEWEATQKNPKYAAQQRLLLKGVLGGARIILIPDADMTGITVGPYGSFNREDIRIVQTAKAMNLPLVTFNKAMAGQIQSYQPYRTLWGDGKVQFKFLP